MNQYLKRSFRKRLSKASSVKKVVSNPPYNWKACQNTKRPQEDL
jgi:hypothetical protein